jgi:hypothetical protein
MVSPRRLAEEDHTALFLAHAADQLLAAFGLGG